MINVQISNQSLLQQPNGVYCFVVSDVKDLTQYRSELASWCPDFDSYVQSHDFTGKSGQVLALPFVRDGKLCELVVVGMGLKNDKNNMVESYCRAVGIGVRHAVKGKYACLTLVLPDAACCNVSTETLIEKTTVTAQMSAYHFDSFITDEKKKELELVDVMLCGAAIQNGDYAHVIPHALRVGRAVNKARHWIDLPPSMLTPPNLADKAQEIANDNNLKITIFNEKEIIKMGMGGLAAVSRGSDVDCRLLIMEYKSDKKDAQTVAFVGKGITFDSGGLSLKPPRYMETMKEDMSGAAAVIASMEVVAHMNPDINVIGVAALSENLPSGKATKPGDIIQFYNGKTAEVKNTDAEGRLVLADALSYTVKHYSPDAIIDFATLTGACAYALGPFYTGMMSPFDDLVAKVDQAGKRSGDYVWRLPFGDDYAQAIQSPVADICNIGNEKIMAGATTAAHFLHNFVDDTPWVHLDIAGTAYDVPHISYYRAGATGVGVRLIIDLVTNWSK